MAFSLLGRVLDIEWMLHRDAARPASEVARHDRELLRGHAPADAERGLDVWLAARRRELGERTLGKRASELLAVLHALLIIGSWAAGAGTARVLLRGPEAAAPTNVLTFLFATLVWPLGLLLGSALLFALRGRLGRAVLVEDIYLALLAALERLSRSAREPWSLGQEWRALRRAGRRYRDLELAVLLSAAQWYPASFHLGAACTLLGLALVTDLGFAWSTTHGSLHWSTLTTIFQVASAPWCGPFEMGCVSPELVRATQYSRFAGRYALPEGAALSGAWWPVLGLSLLVYGVLPRLGFALALRGFAARRAARLSERVLELRGRLRAGVEVTTDRTGAEPDVPERAPPRVSPSLPAHDGVLPCWVIRWRGAALPAPELDALCTGLGLRPAQEDAAGGSDFEQDSALLAAAGARAEPVVLLAEGWEAPDKATRRFVQALRQSGPPDRPVFVCVLLDRADAPELAVWRDRLGLLGDPFVDVRAAGVRARAGEAG